MTPRLYRSLLGHAVLCVGISFLLACGPGRAGDFKNLERADELSRAGDYEGAIDAYRRHMNFRLSLPKRPDWENPYFYLILIGDIQLGQNDVEAAETSYLEAQEKGVDLYLISDRFRGLARWHEERDDLPSAIAVLERYRSLDNLLYDSMLDRISRELTRREDEARGRTLSTPLQPTPSAGESNQGTATGG